MDITYRIPSKKVPYGYLEFTVKDGELPPNPEELAVQYAGYIKRYRAAEVAAFEAAPGKPQPAKPVADEVDEAAKMLNDGLDGVTEIDESDPPAPWDKSSDETESTTESKPWNASDGDWDFS